MPKPMEGQTKEEFIKEFMGDNEMVDKYPDEKQRYAVAISYWENKDKMMESDQFEVYALDKSPGEIKPTEKEQWIKIFPRGEFYIEKLNRKLSFDDGFYTMLSTAFNSESLSKPFIDKNHEFTDSFGDILELQSKKDGLYSKVKLNKAGIEIIKDRKYKYISPAWGKTKDINGTEYPAKLKAVSLTNYPALEGALPEIQSQIELSKTVLVGKNKMEVEQMEILEKISKALECDIQLNNETDYNILLTKIESIKTAKKEAEESAIKLSKELSEIKLEGMKAEAMTFIQEQIRLEKMHPAIQDIVLSRYLSDKESVIKEYSLIPCKEKPVIEDRPIELNGVKLTDNDIELMGKIGYDPKNSDDVKQYKIHVLDKREEMKKRGGK